MKWLTPNQCTRSGTRTKIIWSVICNFDSEYTWHWLKLVLLLSLIEEEMFIYYQRRTQSSKCFRIQIFCTELFTNPSICPWFYCSCKSLESKNTWNSAHAPVYYIVQYDEVATKVAANFYLERTVSTPLQRRHDLAWVSPTGTYTYNGESTGNNVMSVQMNWSQYTTSWNSRQCLYSVHQLIRFVQLVRQRKERH